MKRDNLVGKGDLRRPAAEIEPRHKNIRILCNMSECWIVVLKTDLCHLLVTDVVLISVLAKTVLVSPLSDAPRQLS